MCVCCVCVCVVYVCVVYVCVVYVCVVYVCVLCMCVLCVYVCVVCVYMCCVVNLVTHWLPTLYSVCMCNTCIMYVQCTQLYAYAYMYCVRVCRSS